MILIQFMLIILDKPSTEGKGTTMKDKMITIKASQSFKERLKEAADYYGINQSQFVIQAINEKLERRPASVPEESQN